MKNAKIKKEGGRNRTSQAGTRTHTSSSKNQLWKESGGEGRGEERKPSCGSLGQHGRVVRTLRRLLQSKPCKRGEGAHDAAVPTNCCSKHARRRGRGVREYAPRPRSPLIQATATVALGVAFVAILRTTLASAV